MGARDGAERQKYNSVASLEVMIPSKTASSIKGDSCKGAVRARYLADLQAGPILGKGNRAKKPSDIVTDTGRIERLAQMAHANDGSPAVDPPGNVVSRALPK
ncbi:hypothetical protein V1280_004676 [Bradyrhizobium sp. AZCC 2230]